LTSLTFRMMKYWKVRDISRCFRFSTFCWSMWVGLHCKKRDSRWNSYLVSFSTTTKTEPVPLPLREIHVVFFRVHRFTSRYWGVLRSSETRCCPLLHVSPAQKENLLHQNSLSLSLSLSLPRRHFLFSLCSLQIN